MEQTNTPDKYALVIVPVLVVAAWVRCGHLDACEFKYDEARIFAQAAAVCATDTIPAVGLVSSQGVRNFPLTFVLVAPFYRLNPDPVWLAGVFAAFGTLTVLVLYLVVRAAAGTGVGLVAAVLMAVSPWAVLFSRKISNVDLIPFFAVCLFGVVVGTCVHRRSWQALAVPVLWAFLVQVHWSAITLGPLLAIALVLVRRRLRPTALAAGTVIAIAMFAPFLAYQAAHGWADLRGLASLGGGAVSRPIHELALESAKTMIEILGAGGWQYVTGESEGELGAGYAAWRHAARIASYAAAALFALGALSSARQVILDTRKRGEEPLLPDTILRAVALGWIGSVLAATALSGLRGVHPHFLLVTYPASFCVVALGSIDLGRWLRRRGRFGAVTLGALGVALVVAALGFDIAFQLAVGGHGGTSGDYGVIYRHKRDVAEFLVERDLTLEESVANFEVLTLVSAVRGQGEGLAGPQPRAVLVNPFRGGGSVAQAGGERRHFGPLIVVVPSR